MTLESYSKPVAEKYSRVNVELYDCGCKVRFYEVDPSEWEGDLPDRRVTVREMNLCSKHYNNVHSIPPRDSRLITVFGEYENFLNE